MFFRPATRDDIVHVVALLGDDLLGKTRETQDLATYLAAFDAMQAEGGNHLIVGEKDGQIGACYQITFISGLSLSAARRAQVEGVRIASHLRGQGYGVLLFEDAEARARAAGCTLFQLTSNKARDSAHRFYDRIGMVPSHLGYKKHLSREGNT
ncbi:MAG: GNAT family N-acetyltransferase [Paracoccus sp. (in: a-proteobacteria)]|nr:GNAT family N-acetyltransferase [Paracoccus sp. (in: a-proteobacteria)]